MRSSPNPFEDGVKIEGVRNQSKPNNPLSGCSLVLVIIVALFVGNYLVIQFEYSQVGPVNIWENHTVVIDDLDWSGEWLGDVAFHNGTHGWAVGRADIGMSPSEGVLLRSVNGGIDWELALVSSGELNRISIVNENIIWLAGNEGLFQTVDGGENWTLRLNLLSNSSESIAFSNSTHGLASVNNELIRTTDGGVTWNLVESWNFSSRLYQIHFVGDSTVWACGYEGIFKSSDNGLNWVEKNSQSSWAISPITETEVWALELGDQYLIHTTDGETWSERFTAASYTRSYFAGYRDIDFIDSDHGWVAGTTDLSIMYTPNGGKSWFLQDDANAMKAVDFINETHGWAVGWRGVVYRTTMGNRFGSKMLIHGYDLELIMGGIVRIPYSIFVIDFIIIFGYPVGTRIQQYREGGSREQLEELRIE